MDYIRTKVSGKKHRYIDEKYNLDLSYITPRIIAMAFPGSGIKKIYRNAIDDVSEFLKEKHGDHFLILNLSGIEYDGKKFDGNVFSNNILFNNFLDFLGWKDHFPPQLDNLFTLIEKMHKFILADEQNVVVVNCNAGKGRTGTLICCYLLFSGKFKTLQDALDYYSLKRFNKGFGVTHASQKRYVNYFFDIMRTKVIPLPKLRYINKIEVTCYPFFEGKSFQPCVEVNDCDKEVFNYTIKEPIKLSSKNENNLISLSDIPIKVPIHGDILIQVFNKGVLQKVKMGRISFCSWFINKFSTDYLFPLSEIDPYKFPLKNKVKEQYGIKLHFEEMCNVCKNVHNVTDYCEKCKKMLVSELERYKSIQEFLKAYKIENNNGDLLLFGKNIDDVREVLSKRNLLSTPKIDRRDPSEIKKDANCYIF